MKTKGILDRMNDYFLSFQQIGVKDKLVFYRLLSTMTNAGMSLIRSVSVLEEQEKNAAFKKILYDFIEALESWSTLSECLLLYPKSFTEAEVWIVKSWEKTWKLNVVLLDLADQIEKMASISWKLKSAMIYPAFIIVVVIGVISIMMIVVVPRLLDIFEDKSKLPTSTQILMWVSDFMVDYWHLMLIFFIWAVVWVKIWRTTMWWKYLYDLFFFKVPIFGNMNQKLVLSKFSRLLSWLISSWISIVWALQIVSEWVWNEVYRQRVLLLKEDIQQWIKIWEALDGDPLFPPMMIQMVKVWEQTAKLDQTILKIADFYDEEVDNIITTLNKLLEPMIIVFLAFVVGWISVAIMEPVMNLAETVSNQ